MSPMDDLLRHGFGDPMLLDGWVQFNEKQWGVRAHYVELESKTGRWWTLRTVLYENRRGVLITPPRNPYIPIEFLVRAGRLSSINRCKREAILALAQEMSKFRSQRSISLDPWLTDVRAFQWAGQSAEPRYTYLLDLPGWRAEADKSVLQKARKAEKLGYKIEQSNDYLAIQECLKSAQRRKNFDHRVNARELEDLAQLLGSEHFVCFLARDSKGEPKGAWVRMYVSGGRSLAWSAGVKTEALTDGVNSLLGVNALSFFEARGCETFDFVGANIPPVAAMKEAWGGSLVPYYMVTPITAVSVARSFQKYLLSWMNR